MKVLSLDPGGTTGICYMDENTAFMMTETNDMFDFLTNKLDLSKSPVDHIVMESYRIRPDTAKVNIAQQGTVVGEELKEAQIIGAVKLFAKMNSIPVTFYEPKMKPTQCKLTQVFPKKMPKREEHKWDAFNHGRYFLIQKGLAKTALEIEKGM